ncbi:hypothetical protein ACHAXA_009274 [Cyclostephanos tholiformis]|jgi:hypothetical protein|uniref:Bud22 domain-containing protein n=1 Tax=Cyclostephanos tholiformis TaxID=382380 RepID=A0ABD3RER2_9STRA
MSTTDDTNPSKQSVKSKNKKLQARKSLEEQFQIESIDRYNKLNHVCSKHLHREAKVVKSFECQKIVRAIKAVKDSLGVQTGRDDDNSKEKKEIASTALKKIQTLELKLVGTKKMDLDFVVQVGLKRIGVLNLDPRVHADHYLVVDENSKNASIVNSEHVRTNESQQRNLDPQLSPQFDDPFYQTLLESMLRHKRLSTCLDQLNEKITEYRQWSMRRESIRRGECNPEGKFNGGYKTKKPNNRQGNTYGNDTIVVAGGFNGRKRGLDLAGHEGASGIFIGSLAGNSAEASIDGGKHDMDGDEVDEDNEYGYQEDRKKNRPGQRARRAKATAIEARKAGKTWDSSMNWRERKRERKGNTLSDGKVIHEHEGEHGERKRNKSDDGGMPKAAQHIATMGKTWKEEGNAHPSWAAAAAQKSQGIVKFEGKKITFN